MFRGVRSLWTPSSLSPLPSICGFVLLCGYWRAAAWLLERKNLEDFPERQPIGVKLRSQRPMDRLERFVMIHRCRRFSQIKALTG